MCLRSTYTPWINHTNFALFLTGFIAETPLAKGRWSLSEWFIESAPTRVINFFFAVFYRFPTNFTLADLCNVRNSKYRLNYSFSDPTRSPIYFSYDFITSYLNFTVVSRFFRPTNRRITTFLLALFPIELLPPQIHHGRLTMVDSCYYTTGVLLGYQKNKRRLMFCNITIRKKSSYLWWLYVCFHNCSDPLQLIAFASP